MDPSTGGANAPRDSAGSQRLFTLGEANALLPRVRLLLQAILARAERLNALQDRLTEFRAAKSRGDHAVEGEARIVAGVLREADRIGDEIRGLFAEVREIGCEVKDVQTGLVDFPARREERTIYLCWRLGEDEIAFWHELDAGFSGRQPL